ncbi:hypothetical protein BLNAU_13957 [Blattamonas nauphoetae]|nr:hypothetical protein BLNAU_13957 [Blattamonas nauphoetae]
MKHPQPIIELCLLMIQQELELFWQMLSLSNMSEPDFVSSFGFPFSTLQMFLQKMKSFIESTSPPIQDNHKFYSQLLSKLTVVKARLSDVGKDRVSAFDTDILNTIDHINVVNDVWIWYQLEGWKAKLPKIEDEISETQILEMEEKLKKLNHFVYGHMHNQKKTEFDENLKTLALKKTAFLPHAWTLYDFFGSLAMTLPAGTICESKGLLPYQPIEGQEWKDRKNEDVMKAMQYVSSIIGHLEYTYIHILKDHPESRLQFEEEKPKYYKTMEYIWEHLPPFLIEIIDKDSEDPQKVANEAQCLKSPPPHERVAHNIPSTSKPKFSSPPRVQVAQSGPSTSKSKDFNSPRVQVAQSGPSTSKSKDFSPPHWLQGPKKPSTGQVSKREHKPLS